MFQLDQVTHSLGIESQAQYTEVALSNSILPAESA